jgi:hypothetical protein
MNNYISLDSKDLILLRETFENAHPFRHVKIDNVLTESFLKQLNSDFPSPMSSNYYDYCKEDGGRVGTNYANGDLNAFPPAFKELDQLMASQQFQDFLKSVTGIDDLEYDPDYFGGGIRASTEGTFLPIHLDFNYHPRTLHHRRLNVLLYLNPEWEESMGGHIQVHLDPNVYREKSLCSEFLPINNRLFIFETSETSWHGFKRLNLQQGQSRKAFSIYYYTKTRPGQDEIKLRNTEYVEPGVPTHFVPNHRLTEEDINLINVLLKRRDDRIAMLYQMRRNFDDKYAHLWHEYEYYLNAFKANTVE